MIGPDRVVCTALAPENRRSRVGAGIERLQRGGLKGVADDGTVTQVRRRDVIRISPPAKDAAARIRGPTAPFPLPGFAPERPAGCVTHAVVMA